MKLSDNVTHKFTEVIEVDGWEIETDSGWQPLENTKQTVQYREWVLLLKSGITLTCADNHIVFRSDYTEVFVKDLSVGDQIVTKNGIDEVVLVAETEHSSNMYDVTVDSEDHTYYTNDILSHNTTVAAGYLLWYTMFNPDTTTLVASNKFDGAAEIMQKIRYAYESCPDHIRAGVTSYNKKSLEFDNGARIIAQTTTPNTGRGLAISCLSSDETMVTVRDKLTGEIFETTIIDLIRESSDE